MPLRTLLGSEVLGCRSNPNRPRGKPMLCATTSAAAQRSDVGSVCPRRIGPVIGGSCQSAPDPDAVSKEAPWFYTEGVSGSGVRSSDNPFYLSVGRGCSRAMQGDLRGVPRGERPRRFFPRFLIGEKSGPAERPTRLARLHLANGERSRPPAEQKQACCFWCNTPVCLILP